ncbi:MAG TPA: glycosyltransferase family 39 protein [Thermomicrobiales bacterium]
MTVDVNPLIGDEGNYVGIAHALAAGHGTPDKWPWLRPPGYPLVLAAVFRLTNDSLAASMVLQAIAGTATVGVAGILASRLWGRRAAMIAVVWAALDLSLIYYTRMLTTEEFSALALASLALLLTLAAGRWSMVWLAAAGVLAGIAALFRPAILVVLPLVMGWIVWRERRARLAPALGRALLFGGLALATISPVTVHNWYAYHRVILLDTTAGYTFWQDHRDPNVTRKNLTERLMSIPNPGDRQSYALHQGIAYIREHPWLTLRDLVGRPIGQWGETAAVPEAIERHVGVADVWRNGIDTLMILNSAIIIALAIVALFTGAAKATLAPAVLIAIVAPTIGAMLGHNEQRYLLPSVPILIALASGAIASRSWRTLPRRRWAPAGASLLLFVALVIWVRGPIVWREGRGALFYGIGRVAEKAQAPGQARQWYLRSLETDHTLSEPHLRLAIMASAGGDGDGALTEALTALERDADNFRARDVAAQLYLAQGHVDQARNLFDKQGPTAPDGLEWAWDHRTRGLPSGLSLDGSDLGFVQGFYGTERGNNRDFRWAGDDAFIRLRADGGSEPREIALVLTSARAPTAPPLPVAVFVNGQPAGIIQVHQELGWNEITVPLPAQIDQTKPLTIELRAPAARNTESNDQRALSVAVASVAVR